MKAFQALLAMAFSLALHSVAANAQDMPDVMLSPSSAEACTGANLNGLYALVYFNENPPGKEARWRARFKYEYINIIANHQFYNSMALTKQLKSPAEALKLLGPVTSYKPYALGANGALELYSDKNIGYRFTCVAAIRSEDIFQKGDVAMTGYSKSGGNRLFKLFRRWQ